jgi:DNA processing protein
MTSLHDNKLSYLLALWRLPGIGPANFFRIVESGQPLSAYLNNQMLDWKGVEKDLAWAHASDCHIITYQDDHYPPQLKEIAAFPPLLFVQGDISLLKQPQVGIVGSRNATPAGIDTAFHFAKTLAAQGLVITSGLARGIDGASHEGALHEKQKTIAVMGTGPDVVYPRRHQTLFKKIVESGCIVTEFPTGTSPQASHFPRRNRIISGLSRGILVVEAAYASGSLITAKYALEQNREVFAIPGAIHNPFSRGCHALIKQGAILVESAAEILEALGYSAASAPNPAPLKASAPKALPDFLQYLGFEATPVDVIISRSGLTAEKVSSILLLLELEGHVTSAPGGYLRLH